MGIVKIPSDRFFHYIIILLWEDNPQQDTDKQTDALHHRPIRIIKRVPPYVGLGWKFPASWS